MHVQHRMISAQVYTFINNKFSLVLTSFYCTSKSKQTWRFFPLKYVVRFTTFAIVQKSLLVKHSLQKFVIFSIFSILLPETNRNLAFCAHPHTCITCNKLPFHPFQHTNSKNSAKSHSFIKIISHEAADLPTYVPHHLHVSLNLFFVIKYSKNVSYFRHLNSFRYNSRFEFETQLGFKYCCISCWTII